LETVVIRLWEWPADTVAPQGIRGVVRLVRTGEELAFRGTDELVAILERWSRHAAAEPSAP
jgi:hypothetical protein